MVKHLIGPRKPLRVAIEKKHPSPSSPGPPDRPDDIARIYARACCELFDFSSFSGKDTSEDRRGFKDQVARLRSKVLFSTRYSINKSQTGFILPYVETANHLIGLHRESQFRSFTALLHERRVFVLEHFRRSARASLKGKLPEDAFAWSWYARHAQGTGMLEGAMLSTQR